MKCEKCNSELVNCYQLISSNDFYCFCNSCGYKWTIKTKDEINN